MTIGNLQFFNKRIIGPDANPLMVRYILFRCAAFGVYLHNMRRSDYDRALHNHPWPFVSVVLRGGYLEHHDQTVGGYKTAEWHKPGSVLVRPAEWRHRFEIEPGIRAWTLVIVGRRKQRWGFFLPTGFCWWRQHNEQLNICEDRIIHTDGKD